MGATTGPAGGRRRRRAPPQCERCYEWTMDAHRLLGEIAYYLTVVITR